MRSHRAEPMTPAERLALDMQWLGMQQLMKAGTFDAPAMCEAAVMVLEAHLAGLGLIERIHLIERVATKRYRADEPFMPSWLGDGKADAMPDFEELAA